MEPIEKADITGYIDSVVPDNAKFVVTVGFLYADMTLYGPFEGIDEALEWADKIDDPWVIAPLWLPDE